MEKPHWQNHLRGIYFWNTQSQAEIDFIIPVGQNIYGIEAKFSDAPKLTPSMRFALEDLKLQKIFVVYPGEKKYFLHDKVEVVPLADMPTQFD